MKQHLDDLLFILGSIMLFYGTYQVYQPLPFILFGVIIMLLGMGVAKRKGGVNK